MKAVPNKSVEESQETVPAGKLSVKEEFAKATGRNLTTLEVIGLAVLIMFPLGLFLDLQTDDDNRNVKFINK